MHSVFRSDDSSRYMLVECTFRPIFLCVEAHVPASALQVPF